MKTYTQMKKEHQEKINSFPMAFAFSNEQFKKAMNKLGLTTEDKDKVLSIPGGGIIRKTDKDSFRNLYTDITKEQDELMKNDAFMIQALRYELNNHEFGYTGDPEPTFDALGLDVNDLNDKNGRVWKNYKEAKKGLY